MVTNWLRSPLAACCAPPGNATTVARISKSVPARIMASLLDSLGPASSATQLHLQAQACQMRKIPVLPIGELIVVGRIVGGAVHEKHGLIEERKIHVAAMLCRPDREAV